MVNKIFPGLCLVQGLIVALCAASCREPPVVPYSKWTVDASNGTKVSYKCQKGQLFGEDTLFCNASQQWHTAPPECKEMCRKPPQIDHAELQYPASESRAHAVGTKVHYKCVPGYSKKSGQTESFCMSNFTWSNPSLVCGSVTTPLSLPPVMATISAPRDQNTTEIPRVTTNAVPTLSPERDCSKKTACGKASDSWKVPEVELFSYAWLWIRELLDSMSSPRMEPGTENGEMTTERQETYTAENKLVFQCISKFQPEGAQYVACTENGSWKPELPNCVKSNRSCPLPSTVPHMKEFLYHGKKLEDLKPHLERYKLSLEIQKLQLEIRQKQKA